MIYLSVIVLSNIETTILDYLKDGEDRHRNCTSYIQAKCETIEINLNGIEKCTTSLHLLVSI